MLYRLQLFILLEGLTLLLCGPSCQASSLGMTVYAVPLNSDGGKTVWAHFTVLAPSPCPSLTSLCAAGEDCLVYPTSLPFNGSKPDPGWCVRQWQKVVPSNYNASITLGSRTEIFVSLNAGPVIRGNSKRLNRPPYVGLPPPLRARVNCHQEFFLSVKDLDGDRVRCRFAHPEKGECVNCQKLSFIELDEEGCILTFTGGAQTGQYFIYLMVEDLIPAPKLTYFTDNTPLSSLPVHLSLTVEESAASCSDELVVTGDTPKKDSTLFVLPYQEAAFNIKFMSQLESILEIPVVGPPELYRTGFKTVGPLAMITMAWIRSSNNLTQLLPICFTANSMSLQSEPRCIWLYQREMRQLPAGTDLRCEKTEMILVLPVATLSNINLAQLQLNSPICPITYNSTHLTAHISLTGCGTKTVNSGTELVYTNTLQSVYPYTVVRRQPSLILPLACRIPGVQASGPQYKLTMPTEKEVFGVFEFHMELHLPGQGSLSNFTRTPVFRSLQPLSTRRRREAQAPSGTKSISKRATNNDSSTSGATGTRISQLDLYVMSNCSVAQAQLIVSTCVESDTADFKVTTPILKQGCLASNNTIEIVTTQSNVKIYRLDLGNLAPKGSVMYVQCTVNLCIATMPSQTCPDLCTRDISNSLLVNSVFTSTYTIISEPVSLEITTPAPSTTAVTTITQPTTTTTTTTTATTTATIKSTTAAQNTTKSYAPERAPAMAVGVILTTTSIFFQNLFLY